MVVVPDAAEVSLPFATETEPVTVVAPEAEDMSSAFALADEPFQRFI